MPCENAAPARAPPTDTFTYALAEPSRPSGNPLHGQGKPLTGVAGTAMGARLSLVCGLHVLRIDLPIRRRVVSPAPLNAVTVAIP